MSADGDTVREALEPWHLEALAALARLEAERDALAEALRWVADSSEAQQTEIPERARAALVEAGLA